MENSEIRAPTENRPPSIAPVGLNQPQSQSFATSSPRPQLVRADSRSSLPPQAQYPQQGPRPGFQPPQPRPQFQPGGLVANPPQGFVPRPGTPAPRPLIPPGALPPRPQQLLQQRSYTPQTFAPQQAQGPRPLQSAPGQQIQRGPPPNNIQIGPRQPPQFAAPSTPTNGTRPQFVPQHNGTPRSGQPLGPPGQAVGQFQRQSSQGSLGGLETSIPSQNKPANLDNSGITIENQNITRPEHDVEISGLAKGRSFSIAAAPGSPSPYKVEDDRRKSISGIGGRGDEFVSRTPGLGLIQEGRTGSRENIRGSRESVRSVVSNEGGKDNIDRAESKMSESFIGSLPNNKQKIKVDDDDDVVLHNSIQARSINDYVQNQNRTNEQPDRHISNRSVDVIEKPLQNMIPNTVPVSTRPVQEPPKQPQIKTEQRSEQPKISVPAPQVMQKSYIDAKPPMSVPSKPTEFNTSGLPPDPRKSMARKTASAPRTRTKDGDNDSGVDEFTQGNDVNGSPGSPNKRPPSKLPTKEKSSSSIKHSLSRSSSKSATARTPENPPVDKKKVPMNKIQVGNAPSPNIKAVKSKIGSLQNTTYKPGGGKVKIENKKIELTNVTPRIAAKNDAYVPTGGTKKILSTKLEWNAKSKIGSLENATYKPKGGDKKIETVKLDFKDKAKPKVGSTSNITHKPGGGTVKIENQKLEIKAQSKVGSLDYVKHKPGGGDVKIFNDTQYIKQISGQKHDSQQQSRQEDYYEYMSIQEWADDEERPMSRCYSARVPRAHRAVSPRKHLQEEDERVQRINERNIERNERTRRSMSRPASARDPNRSARAKAGSVTHRPAFNVY